MRILPPYLLWVEKVINCIEGLDEKFKDDVVIWKILISLPSRFNPKVSLSEEISNIDKLNMEMLHQRTHKIWTKDRKDKSTFKEATFVVSKQGRNNDNEEKYSHECDEE